MGVDPLHFEVSRVVAASNEAVWCILGDFGAEHRWTRTLVRCERDTPGVAVGTARTCTLPRPLMGRTTVREALTEFERGVALAYDLDGAAGPFLTASSRWSTVAISGQVTEVRVQGRFTPRNRLTRWLLWPLVKPMIRRLTRRVLGELEVFLARNPGAIEAPK